MKAVVAAFNQEKALVGAFSVITNLRMEVFEALAVSEDYQLRRTIRTNRFDAETDREQCCHSPRD